MRNWTLLLERFLELEHISAGLNRGIPWDVWMMESGGIDSIFGG